MSFEKDLLWNNKLNNQDIFDLAETTHYPEDDVVISELIKILSKQSREFWKTLYHRWWHKKARVLPIWRTWWRLLLVKEWKETTVDSFCNHDDYWDRLADIKN